MLLNEIKNLLNDELTITVEDQSKEANEFTNYDYFEFSDIEDSKLNKEVVSIDTWTNAKNEKAYYIVIK